MMQELTEFSKYCEGPKKKHDKFILSCNYSMSLEIGFDKGISIIPNQEIVL